MGSSGNDNVTEWVIGSWCAGSLISQRGSTIKPQRLHTVTSRYSSWHDLWCCQDVNFQQTTNLLFLILGLSVLYWFVQSLTYFAEQYSFMVMCCKMYYISIYNVYQYVDQYNGPPPLLFPGQRLMPPVHRPVHYSPPSLSSPDGETSRCGHMSRASTSRSGRSGNPKVVCLNLDLAIFKRWSSQTNYFKLILAAL